MNVVAQLLAAPADRPALVAGEETLTYGDLEDRASRWRGGLQAGGVGPGDRVLLWADNDNAFIVGYLAVLGAGAVAVPLNPHAPPASLTDEIAQVGANVMIAPGAADVAPAARALASIGVEELPLDELDRSARADVVERRADDPALLLFTSGTAGLPRPAVATHGNLLTALASVAASLDEPLRPDDVSLAVIPLFHVLGLGVLVNVALASGLTLVLDRYRSPTQVAELVSTHRVSLLLGPPTLWQALAEADLAPGALESVRIALSGAAKLEPGVRRALLDRHRLVLDEGYGLTETMGIAASSVGLEAPVGSVGELLPGVEARLIDEAGADVPVGDAGELWIRGPMVTPGYFEARADEAAGWVVAPAVDADGWLHTGDLAVVDDDGRLSIVDRLKDLVIVSGFNVHPGEVERALIKHPMVADAAVVGGPDPRTGERLVAFVVAEASAPPDLGPDALIEHCRGLLARYKVPREIEFVSELPRGPVGKVQRRHLR